ncbi:MAG: hypothetical protein ACI9BW_002079 [Gammaproteobacteria bacterium]|jgi:hypothetical protein
MLRIEALESVRLDRSLPIATAEQFGRFYIFAINLSQIHVLLRSTHSISIE